MFKTILTILFFIAVVSPIFAIIEVRDTTPMLQCDTIIEKNGRASTVKILSVGSDYITYKLCSDNVKKIYTVEKRKIQDIKSQTFTLSKPKPIPLFTRAKNGLKLSAASVAVFFVSLLAVIPFIDGDSGKDPEWLIIPYIAILLSPFVIVGSFFYNISILIKAKKVGDQKAVDKAIGGIFISLLPILLFLILFLL